MTGFLGRIADMATGRSIKEATAENVMVRRQIVSKLHDISDQRMQSELDRIIKGLGDMGGCDNSGSS